jgi:2-oxo-4-hydroxy-4-carboxy-5-ureidoimidazoline decarboxylase
MSDAITLDALNAMSEADFVDTLGGIFEHSPWVAEAAMNGRPYDSLRGLLEAMCTAVRSADIAAQLRLVRAHPELAGKAAIRGELTDASAGEQRGAGLDACSPAEYAELTALNRAYRERHGFPFILAVKGHTRSSIMAALHERLPHAQEEELAENLRQIERIAAIRLDALTGA